MATKCKIKILLGCYYLSQTKDFLSYTLGRDSQNWVNGR